jgi:hypothetical protein
MVSEEAAEVERVLVLALRSLPGELVGTYTPCSELSDDTRAQLRLDGLDLDPIDPPALASAGIAPRDAPRHLQVRRRALFVCSSARWTDDGGHICSLRTYDLGEVYL